MATAYEVDGNRLVEELAREFKKSQIVKPPEWVSVVKTGVHKERIPDQADWWYYRAASILRQVYLHPVGVSRLRKKYGGRKNRGHAPERFYPASGNIIRKCLQQLENAGLVKKGRKGREITPEGMKLLDKMASKILVGERKKPKTQKTDKMKKEKVKKEKNDNSKSERKAKNKK